MQWFQDLSSETKGLIASTLALGPALIGIGFALKAMSFALSGLVPAAAAVGAVAKIFTHAGLVALFGKIATAARLLWLAIGGPVGIVLGAAALLIYLAWEPISTFFEGLWESLTSGTSRVSAAFQRMHDALGPIGTSIRTVFDKVGEAWTWMKNLFTSDETEVGKGWGTAIIDGAVAVIDGITDVVADWDGMVLKVTGWAGDVWDWLKNPVAGGDPFAWVTTAWDSALDAVKVVKTGIFSWLKDEYPGAFDWVEKKWDKAMTFFSDPTKAADLIASYFGALTTAIDAVDWGSIGKIIGDGVRKGLVAFAKLIGKLIAPDFKDAANEGINNAMNAVILGLGEYLLTTFKASMELLLGFVDGLFQTDLVGRFQAAWDAVEEWMSEFSLLDAGKQLLQTLADGIIALKDEIKQKFREALGPLGRLLPDSDAEEGPLSNLTESGEAIMNTISHGGGFPFATKNRFLAALGRASPKGGQEFTDCQAVQGSQNFTGCQAATAGRHLRDTLPPRRPRRGSHPGRLRAQWDGCNPLAPSRSQRPSGTWRAGRERSRRPPSAETRGSAAPRAARPRGFPGNPGRSRKPAPTTTSGTRRLRSRAAQGTTSLDSGLGAGPRSSVASGASSSVPPVRLPSLAASHASRSTR